LKTEPPRFFWRLVYLSPATMAWGGGVYPILLIKKPPVVEPVHPFQGCEFHVLKATPGAPSFDDFRLVQAD